MKWLRTLMVSAALCMSAAAAFAADVSYPSVLGGTVVSITPAGTAVKQGDVLADRRFPGRPYAGSAGRLRRRRKAGFGSPGNGCQAGNCRNYCGREIRGKES